VGTAAAAALWATRRGWSGRRWRWSAQSSIVGSIAAHRSHGIGIGGVLIGEGVARTGQVDVAGGGGGPAGGRGGCGGGRRGRGGGWGGGRGGGGGGGEGARWAGGRRGPAGRGGGGGGAGGGGGGGGGGGAGVGRAVSRHDGASARVGGQRAGRPSV